MISLKDKLIGVMRDKESKDVFGAVAALFSVNFFASIVGAVISIIQGRFVSAEELGFFNKFTIVSNYAFFLHLGTFHAIERLYPLYMGKGDEVKAKRFVQVGSFWILFICFALSAVYLVLGGYSFVRGDWKSGFCWLVQIVAAWSTMYGGFLSATYRSGKEFQCMAKASVWNPLIQLLVIPIYWIQPFAAMVVRNCTSVVSTVRLYRTRPVCEKPILNLKDFAFLIREGLPLYLASYVTTTGLDAIRGTFVLIFLTIKDWGYWSFAYAVILLVLQLPTSINAVYQPRIISEFSKTGSLKKTFRLAKQPIIYGVSLMAVVVPLGILAVKFLLPYILPKYVGATNLLIVLLCAVPFKLSDVFASVLNAMHKIVPLNVISFICTGIQIAVSLLIAHHGAGIISFGIGFCAGYACRALFMFVYILQKIKEEQTMWTTKE